MGRISGASLLALTFAGAAISYPTEGRARQARDYPVTEPKAISWVECPAETGLPSEVQCGQLSVPIDWDHPEGEHFDLGLVKLAAKADAGSKIGSLFINPGGPGGLASEMVAALVQAQELRELLTGAFDVIGLDPRGIGLSHAVQCDPAIYNERTTVFPTTEAEYEAMVDRNRRLGESCRERTGPLLDFIDTISAAKDFEAARIAVGDDKLNFMGQSYGSQLGAQYAQLFPDNYEVLALDGVSSSQSLVTCFRIIPITNKCTDRPALTWRVGQPGHHGNIARERAQAFLRLGRHER
jgi:pimeloyl-ACP methyl ester carboxylesterase